MSSSNTCLICRYLTIIVYLNDGMKGGETAFPVADLNDSNTDEFINETELHENWKKGNKNYTLLVSPKKGNALMWYNHHLDENNMLGRLDYFSLHSGLDITEGEKWIMTFWILGLPSKFLKYPNLQSP
ncbi:hypothetical protein HZS_6725 [Henneguya salminicola]|uniref:Transmembrane prolyl 4-hydroxylase (Trinotate prediction) n=1 Tax=Henneguya salminicola TaxID=69463 RepID=A0A6G3MFC9_HENSL|nr:hypothetical protein HZS_6725 [Henneguya salminicola]